MDETKQIRPSHYGGVTNVYEAIKVIDAWSANFNIGNVIKYVSRYCFKCVGDSSKKKEELIVDLMKAKTYLEFEIERLNKL